MSERTYSEMCAAERAAMLANPAEQNRILRIASIEKEGSDARRLRILYAAVQVPDPPYETEIRVEADRIRADNPGNVYLDARGHAIDNLNRRRRAEIQKAEKLEDAEVRRYGLTGPEREVSQDSRAQRLIDEARAAMRRREDEETRRRQAEAAELEAARANAAAEKAAESEVRAAVDFAAALEEARAVVASGKPPADGWRSLAARLGRKAPAPPPAPAPSFAPPLSRFTR